MFKKILSGCLKIALLSTLCVSAYADELMDLLQQNNTHQTISYDDNPDPLLEMIQNINKSEDTPFIELTYQKKYTHAPVLNSSAAMIVNAENGDVLYEKNGSQQIPIASITKLMTAMVVLDSKQNMNEILTITEDDIDYLKNSGSRLTVGTKMTRRDMLHIGLMSSENRAMHALARNYTGGMYSFLNAMNLKAKSLGMSQTVFFDPTGLNPDNKSTPQDLVRMVKAAYQYPLIKQFSTSNEGAVLTASGRVEKYKNSNKLIRDGGWDISLQKTGYIREAGRCMVFYTNVQNKPLIVVLMNAPTTTMRVNDAHTMRSWVMQM